MLLRLRAETLFRACGLATCLWFTLGIVVGPLPDLPRGVPGAEPAARVFLAVLGAGFAALFWTATSRGPSARPAPGTIALLGSQLVLGFTLHTDFLYVVAAELAYLLPPVWAFRALAIQTVGLAITGALLLRGGTFGFAPEFAHLSKPLAAVLTLAGLLVLQLFAFGAGYLAASERRARDLLVRQAAELRAADASRAEAARLGERLAISRDLHDTVGHHLTALAVQLELARKTADGPARAAVERSLTTARALLADVRRVAVDLRRDAVVDLPAALTALTEDAGNPRVSVRLPEPFPSLAPVAATALFRCAQEGVTNALRHAGASRVEILVTADASGVALSVADDGVGASRLVEGTGLTGMRERLREAGGSLDIALAEGRGLRLVARVPRTPEAAP